MMLAVVSARALGFTLRCVAAPFLAAAWVLVQVARPILWASRQCIACAREWDPRLWQRDHDDRSDQRDRLL